MMKRILVILVFVAIQKLVFADVWGNNFMTPGEVNTLLILLFLSFISVLGFVLSALFLLFKSQPLIRKTFKLFGWSSVILLFIFGLFTLSNNPVAALYPFVAGILIGVFQFIPHVKQVQQQ